MTSRKPKASMAQARKRASRDVAAVVEKWKEENQDVRLVLELARRTAEFREPPRTLGIATDIVALPTNSQCPAL